MKTENNLTKYQISIYFNLMKIWASNPELRFNQLVNNLLVEYSNRNGRVLHQESGYVDGFYLKDEAFAEFLEKFVEELI